MKVKVQEGKSKTHLIISGVRASYLHAFEPNAINEGDKPKYSVSCIIPKTETKAIKAINRAIEEAKEVGVSKVFGGKLPKKLKLPLRDGDDDREDTAYENAVFFNANSTRRPGVIARDGSPIVAEDDELYSGCYIAVSVNLYAYDSGGSKGIAVGLSNIMKWADGDRLAGDASTPEDDFSAFIESNEDDD